MDASRHYFIVPVLSVFQEHSIHIIAYIARRLKNRFKTSALIENVLFGSYENWDLRVTRQAPGDLTLKTNISNDTLQRWMRFIISYWLFLVLHIVLYVINTSR
jgi:hypothetical protein